jgi:hypothetical protein
MLLALTTILVPLPVALAGSSINAGVFPVHFASLTLAAKYYSRNRLTPPPLGAAQFLVTIAVLTFFALLAGTFSKFTAYCATNIIYSVVIIHIFSLCRLTRPSSALIWAFGAIAVGFNVIVSLHTLGFIDATLPQYIGERLEGVILDSEFTAVRNYYILASYKITIGGIISVSLFCCLALTCFFPSIVLRIAALSALPALVSLNSRTDLVGIGAASIFLIGFIRGSAFARIFGVMCVGGISLAYVLSDAVLPTLQDFGMSSVEVDRVAQVFSMSVEESSARDRMIDIFQLPIYYLDNPSYLFFGVGIGNFKILQDYNITLNAYGHNVYLNYFGEIGLFGFLSFLWYLGFLILKVRSATVDRKVTFETRQFHLVGLAFLVDRIFAGLSADVLFVFDGPAAYMIGASMLIGFFQQPQNTGQPRSTTQSAIALNVSA